MSLTTLKGNRWYSVYITPRQNIKITDRDINPSNISGSTRILPSIIERSLCTIDVIINRAENFR